MKPLPLYDGIEISSEIDRTDIINIGLLYQKLSRMWKCTPDWEKFDPLSEFFIEIVETMKRNTHIDELLKDHHERMRAMNEQISGRCSTLQSSARFVTGLGLPHPAETGFLWDHNIGVPYLPGTSIKGAVRAWMKLWGQKEDKEITTLLGDDEGEGGVCFFDAYPLKKPLLEVDIINVHYKDYYDSGEPPADYISPNPVFFLTVSSQTRFHFWMYSKRDDINLSIMQDYLKQTSNTIGFGAKTSVGYGQFS